MPANRPASREMTMNDFEASYDLVLKGGRIIDPATGRDETTDIAFADGKVSEIGRDIPANGVETVDLRGLLVVPGLIDLHTHVYWGGTSLGVDAAEVARGSGTTTFVDAGSAGAGIFHGFRRHVIEPSPLRIIPYLNISFPGIFAVSAAVAVGECSDLRFLDARECARVIRANRDLIGGVKVRVGRNAGGASGVAPLDMALEVAEETELPVMSHLDNPPPSRLDVLTRLRRGDILTHCFSPFPNAPVKADGQIREEVLEARRRGVLFDIGHGSGSFGFRTAEAMLTAGFLPDVISSDVHALSFNGPAFDQLVTMSKFVCLGMAPIDVIRASTAAPAAALGRTDIGSLQIGAVGDVTVLELTDGDFEYRDVLGEVRSGRQQLRVRGLAVGGRWWHSPST